MRSLERRGLRRFSADSADERFEGIGSRTYEGLIDYHYSSGYRTDRTWSYQRSYSGCGCGCTYGSSESDHYAFTGCWAEGYQSATDFYRFSGGIDNQMTSYDNGFTLKLDYSFTKDNCLRPDTTNGDEKITAHDDKKIRNL